jgi:hypothetical protein
MSTDVALLKKDTMKTKVRTICGGSLVATLALAKQWVVNHTNTIILDLVFSFSENGWEVNIYHL